MLRDSDLIKLYEVRSELVISEEEKSLWRRYSGYNSSTARRTGQTYSPSFLTFGLTYSKLITDRISIGTSLNLLVNRSKTLPQMGSL